MSFCIRKVWKGREKIQTFEYLENEKSFLDAIKSRKPNLILNLQYLRTCFSSINIASLDLVPLSRNSISLTHKLRSLTKVRQHPTPNL